MTCAYVTRRGKQCTHAPSPGETLCARHLPKFVATTGEVDPEVVLKGLMATRDARTQLRAAVAYIRLLASKKAGCAACAARSEDAKVKDDLYRRYTDEQKAELMAMLERWRQINAAAALQPLLPREEL